MKTLFCTLFSGLIAIVSSPVGAIELDLDYVTSGNALPMGGAPIELVIDDGTSENSIGDAGQFIWFNRFTPDSADFPFQIEEIEVELGTTQVAAGDAIELLVYSDTDGDGDPGTGSVLLAQFSETVQAAGALNSYTLPTPVRIDGPGDVLIGVINRAGSEGFNDFPAALDQTASAGRSWAGSWLSGDAPATPTLPADEQWGTIDSFGFPGNWIVRAFGSGINTIGGTVTGLSGSGLVLQNNGGDDLAVMGDGPFTFDTPVEDGEDYEVTVLTQPSDPNQTCTVTNGSGTASGADVTDIEVECVTETYTVGGNVSGLAGTGLVLQNNGGDDLAIAGDGPFTFDTPVEDGEDYEVTALTQPGDPNQTCTVTNGSGTVSGADVTDVQIDCATDTHTVGGTVSGLAGSGLVLQNTGGDDLAIMGDGAFTFATPITDGGGYAVTILVQPSDPDQTCTVSNGSGTVSGADVTDVQVDCESATFTVGGTVSGLAGSGLVLQNNGGDDLAVTDDGAFTFATPVADGEDYAVTVLTQPGDPDQTCTVTNGAGIVSGADVTDVQVDCESATFTVGGTVSGLAGAGLVLQNNGGDDLAINADGAFVFDTSLADGASYSITVLVQPSEPDQICTVSNASGTVSGADIVDLEVSCIIAGGPVEPVSIQTINPAGLVIMIMLMGLIAAFSLRAFTIRS